MDASIPEYSFERIEAIHAWQGNGLFHPLTCGYDSTHEVLVPSVVGGNMTGLVCTTCGWRQPVEAIPLCVWRNWREELRHALRIILTDAERAALKTLLEHQSDRLACAGCNDMKLDATPENGDLVERVEAFHGYESDRVSQDSCIYANDSQVLRFLRYRLGVYEDEG